MFSYPVVDEACRATNVLLIAAITLETVAYERQTFLLSHRRCRSQTSETAAISNTLVAPNSQTILKRFQRSFVWRHSIIRALYSMAQFISLAFIHTSHLLHISPYTFFAHIQRARNIFSSLMMPLIGESLALRFYFLNSSLRPHQNNLIFLIMLLKDSMNRLCPLFC